MDAVKLWGRRIFVVAGLLVLILLIVDFNGRMAELTRLSAQREVEASQLEMLQSTQVGLEAQIAYATSDAALEAWAREQGRYVLPGDYPIIPLPDPNFEETPELAEVEEEVRESNFESWLFWLFDSGVSSSP